MCTDGRFRRVGQDCHARAVRSNGRVLTGDGLDLRHLGRSTSRQKGIGRMSSCEAPVDYPRKWLHTRAPEIGLERRGLADWRRLRERDDEDTRYGRVLEPHERRCDPFGRKPARAQDLAVVRARRIEKQQRVASRRRELLTCGICRVTSSRDSSVTAMPRGSKRRQLVLIMHI